MLLPVKLAGGKSYRAFVCLELAALRTLKRVCDWLQKYTRLAGGHTRGDFMGTHTWWILCGPVVAGSEVNVASPASLSGRSEV